jgi:hypothetical protein
MPSAGARLGPEPSYSVPLALREGHLRPCAGLGDFCQRTYHLACLFVRLLSRDNSYIARLCACYRFLKTNKNPAQSGTFFSGNRLIVRRTDGAAYRLQVTSQEETPAVHEVLAVSADVQYQTNDYTGSRLCTSSDEVSIKKGPEPKDPHTVGQIAKGPEHGDVPLAQADMGSETFRQGTRVNARHVSESPGPRTSGQGLPSPPYKSRTNWRTRRKSAPLPSGVGRGSAGIGHADFTLLQDRHEPVAQVRAWKITPQAVADPISPV